MKTLLPSVFSHKLLYDLINLCLYNINQVNHLVNPMGLSIYCFYLISYSLTYSVFCIALYPTFSLRLLNDIMTFN